MNRRKENRKEIFYEIPSSILHLPKAKSSSHPLHILAGDGSASMHAVKKSIALWETIRQSAKDNTGAEASLKRFRLKKLKSRAKNMENEKIQQKFFAGSKDSLRKKSRSVVKPEDDHGIGEAFRLSRRLGLASSKKKKKRGQLPSSRISCSPDCISCYSRRLTCLLARASLHANRSTIETKRRSGTMQQSTETQIDLHLNCRRISADSVPKRSGSISSMQNSSAKFNRGRSRPISLFGSFA